MPNRLKLLRDWVAGGGGLMMIGGYFSFQGINGAARWHKTPVEEALPVTCLPFDDRVEMPEGFSAELVEPGHPVLEGLGGDWPLLLGVNEVELKTEASSSWPSCPDDEGGHPLLVAGTPRQGPHRSPGPPTSARTGCPTLSSPGRAMPASGARLWTG